MPVWYTVETGKRSVAFLAPSFPASPVSVIDDTSHEGNAIKRMWKFKQNGDRYDTNRPALTIPLIFLLNTNYSSVTWYNGSGTIYETSNKTLVENVSGNSVFRSIFGLLFLRKRCTWSAQLRNKTVSYKFTTFGCQNEFIGRCVEENFMFAFLSSDNVMTPSICVTSGLSRRRWALKSSGILRNI